MSISDTSLPGGDALRIFISYSRKDTDVADALLDALKARGFSIKIDRRDLPYGEKWQEQLTGFIAASDTIIFLLSPDSIQSRWCRWELEEVSRLSKRLFVIRIRDTGAFELPAEIKAVQILPQVGLYAQREHENTLVSALNTDSAWLRKGSTLADDAREWLGHDQDSAMLLRGRALVEAEKWVVRKPHAAPQPPADVVALIAASRQARTTSVRRLIAGVIATVVAASVTAGWYWHSFVRIQTAYCRNYAEAWAEPVCIGPLTPDERAGRAITYAIDSQGGRVVEMQRLNGSNAFADATDYPNAGFEVEPWDRSAARWVYARRENGLQVTQSSRGGVELRVMDLAYDDATRKGATATYRANGAIERQILDAGSLDQIDPDRSSRSRIGQYIVAFDPAGRVTGRLFEVVGGGAGASDADGAFGRAYTYRADGLVASVTSLGPSGSPVSDKMGIQTQARSHSPDGDLIRVELRGADGKLVASKTGVAGFDLVRDGKGNLLTSANFDGDGEPTPHSETGVTITRFAHDERGNIVESRYLDNEGEPVRHKTWGVEMARWSYNANGDHVRVAYFDRGGNKALRAGWMAAGAEHAYDSYRWVVETRYFGLDDKPAVRADLNIARETWIYTPQGKSTEARFFGVEGKPALRKDWHASTAVWSVNRYGYITNAQFRDAEGKPTLRRNGKFAFGEWYFDEHGNNIEARFFGTDRKPIPLDETGASRARYAYDPVGNRTDERFFDGEDNAVVSKLTGSHHTRWTFDAQGNTRSVSFLDANGRLVPRKDNGYARRLMEYNARGELVRERFEDAGGELFLDRKTGAAFVQRERDRFGREVKRTFLGLDGSPTPDTSWGVASVVTEYNEHGAVVSESYWDVDGRPTLRRELGAWKIVQERDGSGYEVSRSFLGLKGEPVRHIEWGVARIEYQRDGQGNSLREAYFDPDGAPTLRSDKGVASIEAMFGPFGFLSESSFGTAGERAIDNRGVHNVRRTYDSKGNITDERYYGIDGRATNTKENGVPHLRWTHDGRGNWTSVSFLNADAGPAIRRTTGVSQIRRFFDQNDNLILETYADTHGNRTLDRSTGISGIARTRDQYGREVKRAFLAADDRPISHNTLAVANVHFEHDAWGSTVSESYSDAAGKPVVAISEGFWKLAFERDARGQETGRSFLGVDGKPTLELDWGVARIDYERDAFGRVVAESYRDVHGVPTLRTGTGVSRIDREYGQFGVLKESYRGADGQPTVDRRLVAGVRWAYDDRGRTIGETYFDREGNPTERPFLGAHGIVRERNALGWITRERKIDAEGRATSRADYAAETRWAYDARGNMLSKRYFDEAGRPVTPQYPESVATQSWSYDENDRQIAAMHEDENGNPAALSGAVRWQAEYDDFGNEVVRRYFDKDGRLTDGPDREHDVLVRTFDHLNRVVVADYHWSDPGAPATDLPPISRRTTTGYNAVGQRSDVGFYEAVANDRNERRLHAIGFVKRSHDERGRLVSLVVTLPDKQTDSELGGEVRYSYDDRHRLSGASFHKHDGTLSGEHDLYGIARASYVCDARGNLVREEYAGTSGAITSKGFPSRVERTYDDNDQRLTVTYYDRHGKVIAGKDVVDHRLDLNAGIPEETAKRACAAFSK